MKTFSQRKGLKPVSEIIQASEMNAEPRNSLWNALDRGDLVDQGLSDRAPPKAGD
jgi:hypothetical protein